MLLRQSAESLASRVSYLELTPLLAAELAPDLATLQRLWLRGGFPLSWLAADDSASFQWRLDFVQIFLVRDMAQFGVRVPAETLRRCGASGRSWRICKASSSTRYSWASRSAVLRTARQPAISTPSSTRWSCGGFRRTCPTWASGW